MIALAHPGHRGGDIERGPVRHRGLEADQRFGLVIADQRFLPGAAGAAVIIGQDRAAPPRQIAGETPVDLARHRGRRIDQDGMALRRRGARTALPPANSRPTAGKVMSSMKTSSSAASATAFSPVLSRRRQQMRIRLLPQGLVLGDGNPTGGPAVSLCITRPSLPPTRLRQGFAGFPVLARRSFSEGG